MEAYIKYKRFSETHNEKSIQEFFDRLVTGGWEIIYYNEIRQSTGQLSNSLEEVSIHIVALCGKRQENSLPRVL